MEAWCSRYQFMPSMEWLSECSFSSMQWLFECSIRMFNSLAGISAALPSFWHSSSTVVEVEGWCLPAKKLQGLSIR